MRLMLMRTRALALALVVLCAGCSQDGEGEVAAEAASPTPAVRDLSQTPEGNRWWVRTRPAPDDRALDLVVHERACASGKPAHGRVRPVVKYEADSILVTITVEPDLNDQTCPSNPDTPFTLPLTEEVGDRVIKDGRTSPPVTAQITYPR